MQTKKPWYLVAKIVLLFAVVFFLLPAFVILYWAITTGELLPWFLGVLLSFGGGVTIRAAIDLRK